MRIGYAVINTVLRSEGVYTSRTLILKSLEAKGVKEAKRLALLNLDDLLTILKWNEKHGIRFFRCGSNLFSHYRSPHTKLKYTLGFAEKKLAEIGQYIRDHGHRITIHPDHFSYQIGSTSERVVKHAIDDLRMHADTLRMMGLTSRHGSVMVVHGGGAYGDKSAAQERWGRQFEMLPKYVREYIVLENDEWTWSIADLLPFCEKHNIPLCIDFFHNAISKDRADVFELLDRVFAIWKRRGITPKFHYSEQKPGERKGTHSDTVDSIPREILRIVRDCGGDLMLETKLKERSVLAMYKKYFTKLETHGRVEWVLTSDV